jgi:hypothetical protein
MINFNDLGMEGVNRPFWAFGDMRTPTGRDYSHKALNNVC